MPRRALNNAADSRSSVPPRGNQAAICPYLADMLGLIQVSRLGKYVGKLYLWAGDHNVSQDGFQDGLSRSTGLGAVGPRSAWDSLPRQAGHRQDH